MQENGLAEIVELARKAVQNEPEPYKSAAFPVVLHYLLNKGLVAPQPGTDAPSPSGVASLAAGMQLNEFLASKSPKTHPDRVTAIAYYAYHERNKDAITTNDIADAYARARLKKPQNISDVVATCVRRGHLIDTDRKDGLKAWIITRAGEAHVEEGI